VTLPPFPAFKLRILTFIIVVVPVVGAMTIPAVDSPVLTQLAQFGRVGAYRLAIVILLAVSCATLPSPITTELSKVLTKAFVLEAAEDVGAVVAVSK
jgi:hypothetical protein